MEWQKTEKRGQLIVDDLGSTVKYKSRLGLKVELQIADAVFFGMFLNCETQFFCV